jgi:hypothetical protein
VTGSITTWKGLEDALEVLFVERMRSHPFFFHRFYDTRSAGNFLPGQPADFLCVNRGRVHFIEAKFSEKHDSLRNCFAGHVRKNQLASAFLVKRALGSYWLLFHSSKSGVFEIWDGAYCREQHRLGKPLNIAERKVYRSLESAVLGGAFNGYRKDLLRSTSGPKA